MTILGTDRTHKFSRSGFGTLVFLVLTIVAVLFVFAFFQRFISGLNNQREALSSGRRAYYLAEAAINEALLDFEQGINIYSDDPESWFQKVRVKLDGSYSRLETKIFIPDLTNSLCGNDIEDISVQVAFWRQFSVDQQPYNKTGLLTLTAIVRIPRKLPGLWGKYVTRNVQKSYELRSMLISPARPFDGFTYFMDSWPYLQSSSDGYDEEQQNFDEYSRNLDDGIKQEMEGMRDQIQASIDWCKQSVEAYEKGMDDIEDVSSVEWMTNPEIMNGRHANSEGEAKDIVNEECDKEAVKNGFADRFEVKLVSELSADCWMGQAGYVWSSKKVNWPAFRIDGADLSNPVFVVNPTLSSTELTFQWPDRPEEPKPRPSDDFMSGDGPAFNRKVDWQSSCANVASAFSSWCNQWDSQIAPFQSSLETELRRHEGVFKLVQNDWVTTFRETYEPLETSVVYKKRASWVFESQDQFESTIPKTNGMYWLDGIYYIDGPLNLSIGNYIGCGIIASGDQVRMTDALNNSTGCLTIVSKKDMYVTGEPQAALLCPEDRILFRGCRIRGMASHSTLHKESNFDISFDPNIASRLQGGTDRMSRFWVNVSPYHVACNFLRN